MQARDILFKYKWNDKLPTIQMLGCLQHWHYGHRKLFEKCILKIGLKF